jgi:hypothetical protein
MPIRIKYRKLGKEQAWGLAHTEDGLIELDERMRGKKHLEILLHEVTHCQNPDWSEEEVVRKSREMCRLLWKDGYRKVDNSR